MSRRFNASLIIKKLIALPEHTMRYKVLIEQLAVLPPGEVLSLFSEVVRGVQQRKQAYMPVLSAVHDAVLNAQREGQFYELLAEVYRLAREQKKDGVADMLVMAQPAQGPISASKAPGDHELSDLTLGERKFLARCHDRARLDRLLFDPDPSVVRNLLRNPHITEQDVIRLASRRPALIESLREVYKSKWSDRYRIRLSLVCNPYTPTDLSVKLVCFLLKKDLQAINRDDNLHPVVRKQASRLLASKRAGEKALLDE